MSNLWLGRRESKKLLCGKEIPIPGLLIGEPRYDKNCFETNIGKLLVAPISPS